jgi:preprotein translocase subunit SecG
VHSRRLTCLILGLWLGGSLLFAWISSSGMSTAGTAINTLGPKGQQAIGVVGQESARQLSRFVVSEVMREFSYAWGWMQVALGIILFVAVTFSTNGNKVLMLLAGAMLALTLVLHLSASPNISALGRVIDFARAHEFERERRALAAFSSAYVLVEFVKVGLGIAIGAILTLTSGMASKRRRRVVHKLDEIDNANYGRVNR